MEKVKDGTEKVDLVEYSIGLALIVGMFAAMVGFLVLILAYAPAKVALPWHLMP